MEKVLVVVLLVGCLVGDVTAKRSKFDYLHKLNAKSNGGGLDCALCTIAISLLDQMTVIHNKTVEELLDKACNLFPSEFSTICVYFIDTYGAAVIELLEKDYNADEVCLELAFCTDPTCHLWPTSGKAVWPNPKWAEESKVRSTPWDWLLALLEPLIDHSEPVLDLDKDLFSEEPALRGSSWRGRDCNDLDSSVYPGRKVNDYWPETDHNCNGIFAMNGNDYEKMYCDNTGQMGVVVVGDSAGAHFHIPPEYLTAALINETTYDDLLFVISNELDVPQESWSTGHERSQNVFVQSLYLSIFERNRCNHRDYQNICRNGLRSGSSVDMSKTLARNKTTDQPVFMIFELIGNDVCSGHQTFSSFTDPKVFKQNILEVLGNFSETLPQGSHIIFIGLAHGGVLWDALHDRLHPLGVTYPAVYDYLNCLQISPCWGWMNSNETVRNITNDWAAKLSNVYDDIISTVSFPNFDMLYYPFPFEEIMKKWKEEGGEVWQLIEPVDGFHPSQQAHALIAQYLYNDLLQNHPSFIGPENPNNQNIVNLFGDQNGY
uniref:Saposin B-type domain-containing protein n=1 Tax=Arcella intermedia TaxID=1963864 RepID=A0A6B2L147_9EUKA